MFLTTCRLSADAGARFIKLLLIVVCCVCLSSQTTAIRAQSQALNGQIEGTVTDANGAAVANATVTITNIQNGTTRSVTSDESGTYRAPLLPLGTYRIEAEAASFKKLLREGITLTTGQTATIDLKLEPGEISEVVTISGDAPIADPGKIDVGRVMNETEVRNLPLVSRNPYNFALLQANVTGRPNTEFGVPRINANGFARRTNYQLDGNNNTQADRSGIRLMPISETFVSEVQLVTNGFSAEFGNTPGLIMNAVSPSGTNNVRGSVSYRIRRTPFYARPFFYNGATDLPTTHADNLSAQFGGPIVKDRWHYYFGYEFITRALTTEAQRLVNIRAPDQARLITSGVPASTFVGLIPTRQRANFFIGRTDVQLNESNRFQARYNLFRNVSPDNIGGNFNTLQRSIDFIDASDSIGLQLISTFSPTLLNELRYQYARRDSKNFANQNSGTGLTIAITNVALFGAPEIANTELPLESSNQIQDNLTYTRGSHTFKFGGGFSRIYDFRRSGLFARYTFPNLDAYLNALNGSNRTGYTNYVETIGDPEIEYNSVFYNFFAQDDWKITPRLKLNYGLRYDLYDVPDGDPSAALDFSREFNVDKNNFAPRVGVVYSLREGNLPTVVRASAGLYYDPPQLDIYLRALQNNGNPRFFNFSINGGATPGAPQFPNRVTSAVLTRPSVDAVAPDFENMYAIHTNVQIEQALSQNFALTLGYIRSAGRHIPVYRNINPINPVAFLADGRPQFNTAVSAATRLYPQFNNVLMAEAAGNSEYNAGTLSLTKRFSRGYQFSLNYTYSHSIDDAPEQNLVAVTSYVLSDPTNRARDRGNSVADQRHTFVMSFVGRPTFDVENRFFRRLLNDNQFSFITTANSGEVFNIVSNADVNLDGVSGSDRPVFIGRNTGRTPNQFNVDMRYSRFISFSERYRLEVFGEFINLFNRNSIFQVSGTVTTDANGVLAAPLPDFINRPNASPQALDSRQFQLGFKFNF